MAVEPERDLITVHEAIIGDGWDDGAELTVTYTSACSRPTPGCAPRAETEEMAYSEYGWGQWRRIGYRPPPPIA